ncbi:MAG: hypothetical protein QM639_15495 [Rhodocyclaceae bacterium]
MPRWFWLCAGVVAASAHAAAIDKTAAAKTFVCKDDTRFVVEALDTDGPQKMVKVSREGRSDVLRWTRTQRDAYFSNGRVQLWDNGHYATLKRRNFAPLVDCELQDDASQSGPQAAP